MTDTPKIYEAKPDLDPNWVVLCNGKPIVQTVGGDDEENAKKIADALNAFTKTKEPKL